MQRRWISAAVVAALLAIPGLAAAQPANDNFADAEPVSVPFVDARETFDATTEEGEPLPCAMGATVWYSFEAPADATVSADTMGSDFDTALAAYTGADLGSLEELACNDDNFDLTSFMSFDVIAGETYHIQAGGFGGSTGHLTLSVYSPGAIEGTVTDESSAPLGGICVAAYTEVTEWEDTYLDWVDGAQTDEDGIYRLSAVQGEVLVEFSDCENQVYVTEWYDDAPSSDAGTPLLVPIGETLSGVDASLIVGGSISGTLTDLDGDPIEDICVEAVGSDEVVHQSAWTGPGGTYRVGGLPSGDYAVSFNDCGSPIFHPRPVPAEEEAEATLTYTGNDYETEWYDGKSSFETADLIPVELAVDVTGIDADLALRPRPDVAITDLKVANVPLQTDAADLPGPGWSREISLTVDNLGEVRANRARVLVLACTPSDGNCRILLNTRIGLNPGASFSHTLRWNGLGQVGDVRIIANISHFDDPNRSNNRRAQNHYVLVGGTGFGVTL